MRQFTETRDRFIEATGDIYPLSYNEWMILPTDFKAAALYVNFFEQITLAWEKAKADFVPDSQGVSTVLQYLMENVPIIMKDAKKFTPNYIYRVAYNCMGCLRRIKRDIEEYDNTTDRYVLMNDREVDLFDMLVSNVDIFEDIFTTCRNNKLWSLIDNLDDKLKKHITYLIELKTDCSKLSLNKKKVVNQLRELMLEHDIISHSQLKFGHILDMNNDIESATVVMPDGKSAIYFNEMVTAPDGTTKVVFFGDEHDYVIPLDDAVELQVVELEE